MHTMLLQALSVLCRTRAPLKIPFLKCKDALALACKRINTVRLCLRSEFQSEIGLKIRSLV